MLVFRGKRTLRGNGLGGVFSWLKRVSLPLLKQVGSYLGSKLLNAGGNIISDVQAGVEPVESVKTRARETGKEIMRAARGKANSVKKAFTGKGRKKKKLKRGQRPRAKKSRGRKKKKSSTLRIANTDLF